MSMIEFQDQGFFVEIAWNIPSKKNAFSLSLMKQLTVLFRQLQKNTQCRFVVLKGLGDIFSSGADLEDMKNAINQSFDGNIQDAKTLYEMFESFWQIPQPVLCLVQKGAFGGGLGFVALSDWVICDEEAQFCFSEVKLGLCPAVISEFILRKFTLSHMAPYLITGTVFNGNQAQSLGLVQQVVPSSCLEDALFEKKNFLLKLSPQGMRETKSLLRFLQKNSYASETQIPEEGVSGRMSEARGFNRNRDKVIHLIASMRVSPEGQEGLSSFLEKRTPSWVKSL
jgi:methylglutaconyl-CoA hydratase